MMSAKECSRAKLQTDPTQAPAQPRAVVASPDMAGPVGVSAGERTGDDVIWSENALEAARCRLQTWKRKKQVHCGKYNRFGLI